MQARAHEQVGVLGAAGLSLHSFIDGLGIGLAFGVNTTTGLLVFVAVVAHDFADGMNTVSFILSQSDNRRKAVRWLAVDAIAPLIGAIVGASISISEYALGHLLALYAGFFLFMGATDLLPEAHRHPVSAAGRADRGRVRRDLSRVGRYPGVAALARVRAPGELRGHDQHEEREQAPQRRLGQCVGDQHAELDAGHCDDADHERGAPADVPVEMLPPGARDHDRQDRQQRRRLGVDLAEVEQQRRASGRRSARRRPRTGRRARLRAGR